MDNTKASKWYVRCNSADDDQYAVVQLDDDEIKAVTKFLSAERVSGGGYCGSCHLIYHGFDTKEEALDAIIFTGAAITSSMNK